VKEEEEEKRDRGLEGGKRVNLSEVKVKVKVNVKEEVSDDEHFDDAQSAGTANASDSVGNVSLITNTFRLL
jgi:hypothetical protein